MCIARHAQNTQNKNVVYFCNISQKTWRMKFNFCLQINTKVFHKLVVSLWVCIARHTQSAQCNKFAISLKYLRENMKVEVDFLPGDKHQVSSNLHCHFRCMCPSMPKLSKKTNLLFLCNIVRKKWVKLIFCIQITMTVSYKLILWFLMGMVKHSQSFQNSKFTMSLQCLKNEVRD